MKLMRSLEENEREGRALRKTMANQEEAVKEKETIQASSILRELHLGILQRLYLGCFAQRSTHLSITK